MKKLLVFILIGASIISCQSNDDDPSSDPLIGKWQRHQVIRNGIDTTTDCDKRPIVEFKKTETYTFNHFEINNGDCISETENGQWIKENNIYKTYDNGEWKPFNINFENSNNTFYTESSNTYQGVTSTHKEVWKRL